MTLDSYIRSDRPLLSIQKSLNDSFELQSSSKKDFSPKVGVRTSDGKGILLNLEDFDETMMTEEIMSVGRVNPWVKGITSWRGRVFTLIDISILLDCENSSDINNGPVFGSILNTKYDKSWALLWSGGNEGLIDVSEFTVKETENLPVWIDSVLVDKEQHEWHSLNLKNLLTYEKLSKVL